MTLKPPADFFAGSSARRHAAAAAAFLVIALLTFVYFHDVLLGGRVMIDTDVQRIGYATRYYAADEIQHGRFPLWCPFHHLGYPFFAESQGGVLYPLNFVFDLAPLRSFTALFHWMFALHYALAGFFGFLWARRRAEQMSEVRATHSALIPWLAGLFAGVTLEWSGYFIGHLVHVNLIHIAAWCPLQLYLLDLYRDGVARPETRASARRLLLALTATFTVQIFAGHLTTLVYWMVGYVWYAGVISLEELMITRRWPRALGLYAHALAPALASVAWGAVQWLPQAELLAGSSRALGSPAFEYRMTLRELFDVVWPIPRHTAFYEFRYEYLGYVGVVAVILVVAGLTLETLRLKNAENQKARVAQLLTAALLLTGAAFIGSLGLGLENPLYRSLAAVPPFAFMRVPMRFLLVTDVLLAGLAGWGLANLLVTLRGPRVRVAAGALLVSLQAANLLLLNGHYYRTASPSYYAGIPPHVQILKDLMAGAPSLPRAYPTAFLYRKGIYEDTVFQSDGHDYATEVSLAYITLRYRVPYASPSVEFFLPHRTINFIFYLVNHPDRRLYDLVGIRYLVHPLGRKVAEASAEQMGIHEVARTSFAVLRENPGAFPRTFLVPQVKVVVPPLATRVFYENGREVRRETRADESVLLKALLDETTDLRNTAVVETPVPGLPEEPAGANAASSAQLRADILVHDPGRVEVSVKTDRPALLVLTDTWYPGWRATVNGAPARIYRADYLFRGVAVPPGDSVVRFEFKPLSFTLGLWISCVSFALAILWTAKRRLRP